MLGSSWRATVLALTLATVNTYAGGLVAPFSGESTAVLPKGVRNIRSTTLTTEFSEKFNGSGFAEALAQPFNKGVTWNDLLGAVSQSERADLEGYLRSEGHSLDEEIGETHAAINARITSTIPVFAIGLSEKWTAAVAVPVLYSNASAATGWTANSNMRSTIDNASGSGYYNKLKSFESRLQDVIATKLAAYGYKPLVAENKTEIGDVSLVGKYQAVKNSKFAWSVQQRLVLPTGRTSDPDKVLDISPGDGQYDLGVASSLDTYLPKNVTLNFSAGYIAQLPGTSDKRIPKSHSESISPDRDGAVSSDLGDIMSSSFSAKHTFARLWTVGALYSLQYKGPDKYTGGKYASDRYELLSKNTEQVMQSGLLGLSFSTVPLFQAKSFPVPLEASATYSRVLAGRNVNLTGLAAVELSMFF